MSTSTSSARIYGRRGFLSVAAASIAATGLQRGGAAEAQPAANATPIEPQGTPRFDELKQIDSGVLRVGYAEVGPATGTPVILLHGWPYDIQSFVEVAPLLAARGYRVLVPYLRGCGGTTFLSSATVRNGQQGAVAVDTIAFMDALNIERAVIGGFDWGGRTADIIAAHWPRRCRALVSVSGYLFGSREANTQPLPPAAEYGWWYQ